MQYNAGIYIIVALVIAGWIAGTNLIGLILILLTRPKGFNRFGARGVPRTLPQAFLSCLTPYANASGRASRSEFWWFFLMVLIIDLLLNGLDLIFKTRIFHYGSFAFVLPSLCVAIRRLHDINRSGWWVLLGVSLFPIVLYVLYALPPRNEAERAANVF